MLQSFWERQCFLLRLGSDLIVRREAAHLTHLFLNHHYFPTYVSLLSLVLHFKITTHTNNTTTTTKSFVWLGASFCPYPKPRFLNWAPYKTLYACV